MANVVVQPIAPREYQARKGLRRENAQNLKINQEFEAYEDKCTCMSCQCMYPDEVITALKESRYTFVMENRVEWNFPTVVTDPFPKCCKCRVDDNVNVLYFDQPYVKSVLHNDDCATTCMLRCCFCAEGDLVRLSDRAWCKARKPVTMQSEWYLFVKKGQGDSTVAAITTARDALLTKMG